MNENDERPRFDAQTGLPIDYENDETIETVYDEVKGQYQEAAMEDENVTAAAEASEESDNDQYRYTGESVPFGMTYQSNGTQHASSQSEGAYANMNFDIKDEKTLKKESKKARKAAKRSNGSKGLRKLGRMAAASVLCGVIAGASMYGVYYTGVRIFPTQSGRNSNVEIATVNTASSSNNTSNLLSGSGVTAGNIDVTAIAKGAMPAIVAITGTVSTTSSGSIFNPFGGGTQQASTSGTGIIIGKNDTDLFLVTNAHVVENVSNLKVTFNDNESVDATVKGSKTDKDIAVVAVKLSDLKDSTIGGIAIAELGDSDGVQIGEPVVAIGNALGEGQSVTVGWISAMNRSITVNNVEYSNLIMTNAAINPGNSGGALLNAQGQVIGINSAKYASEEVEGMGYAIPISSVKDIIDSLMTKQTRNKVDSKNASFLGVGGIDITSSISSTYGYPQGVLINNVASGSAAEKAGLVKNDIITSFDGESVTSFNQLKSLMEYYSSNEKISVEYYHMENGSYAKKQVDVTLGGKN